MPVATANGKKFTFPEGTTPEQMGSAIDEYFSGQQQSKQQAQQQQMVTIPEQQQEEEKTTLNKISDFFTGADRETRATRELPELPEAAGFLSTEDAGKVAAVAPAIITATEPQEIADILKNSFPDAIGIQYDEKGNIIAANNKTGQRVVLNKPGASGMDVINTLGLGSLYAAGGATGGALRTAATEGLREAAIQGYQSAAGGEFNPEDVALASGLGGAMKAAEGVIGTVARGKSGSIPEQQAEQIAEAEARGIPVSTSDVIEPSTFAGRTAQNIGEQVPVFGTGKAQEAKQAARQDVAEEFVAKFEQPSFDEVIQSLKNKKSKVMTSAGNVLNKAATKADEVGASELSSSLSKIDEVRDKLSVAGRATNPKTLEMLDNIESTLMAGPQNYSLLKDNLGTFREMVDAVDPATRSALPSRDKALMSQVLSSIKKDRDDLAKSALTPQEYGKLQKANAVYGSEAEKLQKTKIKSLFDKGELTPELVERQILSKTPSDVKRLYQSLDTSGRNNARSALINNAWDKSNGSVNVFLNNLNKMKSNTDVFFRGQDRKQLEGLKTALEATRKAQDAAVTTKTGMQNIPYIAGGAAMYDLGATLGTAAATGALTRIYESRPVRNALLKLSSVPKGSTQFEKALEDAVYAITAASQILRAEATE